MDVVFWTGIKNKQLSTKYGGFEWMDYSKQSWQYWCDKNNVTLVTFEEPYSDITQYRANWQKAIHCWDILDERGIDPDNVFLVDASSIIKWDAPNIFEQVDDRLTAWPDLDNLKWVYDSIEGYEPFFNFKLDNSKYVNSGVIVFNKSHRKFFESFKELYYDNSEKFIILENEEVRKGTEQTPFFIKHGYLWFFTGFEKMQRTKLMTQVWNMIKHNYEA